MFQTLALVILAALALLLIYAATRPDSFRVERSARIQASPERVYALINDLQQLKRWNPWERKDPGLKGTFGGTTAGVGAAYGWESAKVGTGRMEITQVQPGRKVAMKLDFIKPFQAQNRAEFALHSAGGATEVRWSMEGPTPFLSKLIGVFVSMDRMIGRDFEDGLGHLKQIAEQGA
ncbi:SRPBCC family protein [Roseateles sp. DAIF2]|uniref:SRPBCC family protein n=1 Tax=Roseateles sp. DAIF2 TaxID=2714952 RepID=UPI0018A2D9AC|nr:SRPBCC family protein [Roseateles sp. DAIF2]QPF71510.1 SRPBCC family protein [Roseateles sp. DAIF2]